MESKVGLVAGNRRLPFQFADWAARSGRDLYIAGIIGEVDPGLKDRVPAGHYRDFHVTEITKVAKFFKRNGVCETVMIGGVAKAKLKLNFDAVKILLRLLFMKNKHKGVFTIILSMFGKAGIKVRAIQDLMPELLIGEGALGKVVPPAADVEAFKKNWPAIRDYISTGDGQAVIIHNGEILAFENIKGTDDLIARATARRAEIAGGGGGRGTMGKTQRGGFMAKIMEPGQDERADLPVVGTGTVETLAKYGLSGVIIEAGRTIADDVEDTIKLADELGVYVYGVSL